MVWNKEKVGEDLTPWNIETGTCEFHGCTVVQANEEPLTLFYLPVSFTKYRMCEEHIKFCLTRLAQLIAEGD